MVIRNRANRGQNKSCAKRQYIHINKGCEYE